MCVSVNYGSALIQGYPYWLEDDGTGRKILTLDYENTSKRIDRIVLRLDKSIAARNISLNVLKGTASAAPVAPELTRNGNVYELSLASILVAANTTSITAENITDERLLAESCGIISSMIDIDTTSMQDTFTAFMDTLNAYVNEALPFVVIPAGSSLAPADRISGRYYFQVSEYYNGDNTKWKGEWQDWNGNALFPQSHYTVPVSEGGTGATTAQSALTALGAAAAKHTHTASELSNAIPISKGGTGATTASAALSSLGAAASAHNHALTSCTGTLSVAKGGTGTTAAGGTLLSNLGIKYGSSAPTNPTTGMIWLKPV